MLTVNLHNVPIYETYNADYMTTDLSGFLTSTDDKIDRFVGKYPSDYLVADPPSKIRAWHSVGIGDPLS